MPVPVAQQETLGTLARKDDLVFVPISRAFAEAMRAWSAPVEIRLDNDPRDPRLRRLTMRKAEPTAPPERRKHRPLSDRAKHSAKE